MRELLIGGIFMIILLTTIKDEFLVNACYLWGTDSGICTTNTLDDSWKEANMPFCSKIVKYPACVPKNLSLPPTREFPQGRWLNHSIAKKDTWVSRNVDFHIYQQIGYETNQTMRNLNRDINGHLGHVRKRFYKNLDCQQAFTNYFCYINFPRCDPDRDLTLPTCRSACENFFFSCKYERGLWRCGKSEYFNGYEPEIPIKYQEQENTSYYREYFPGQPFRENKYDSKHNELPICTPAVVGSAGRVGIKFQTIFGRVSTDYGIVSMTRLRWDRIDQYHLILTCLTSVVFFLWIIS